MSKQIEEATKHVQAAEKWSVEWGYSFFHCVFLRISSVLIKPWAFWLDSMKTSFTKWKPDPDGAAAAYTKAGTELKHLIVIQISMLRDDIIDPLL